MELKRVSVGDISPYENNPRNNEKAVDAVAESIHQCGYCAPIVVDPDLTILAGHTRLEAVKKLGWEEIDVCIRYGLTDEQKRKYRILDNKTAEIADWDFELLADELKDLDFWGYDFGFDETEENEKVNSDVEEVETPDETEPFVKRGDVWELGRHRLMCGDSTNADDFKQLMNGVRADISFTSPPYNAGSLNIKGQSGTGKKYNEYDDNKSEDEYFDFLKSNVALLLKHSNEVFYNIGLVEGSKRSIIRLENEFINEFKDIVYWKKDTVAPHIQPGIINNLVEFIVCFGNGKRKFENAQFHQGTYFNVIEGSNASRNEFSDIHKATFPVYLPANVIANFSPVFGTVIDCFGGTGTTLIACEQLNRTCFMMELDPKYCDVIIARWEAYTGEKAEKINE